MNTVDNYCCKSNQTQKKTTFGILPISILILMMLSGNISWGQVTVFTDDFSTNTNATYTTSGAIGASAWSVLTGGTAGQDFGARRNTSPAQLELTNDATVAVNQNGWSYTSTPTSSFSSPYNTTLSSNGGIVTWTFNIRQIRADPAGLAAGNYGAAFVIAGTSSTTQTVGTGYAITYGQSGATDPIRLVKYTAGLGTSTNIITSNTAGLTDFGAEYISVKVTYTPATNTWELFLRNDGASAFVDPATGSLTSQGTAVDIAFTGTSLTSMGAFWSGSTAGTQTAFFDNTKVTVVAPAAPTTQATNITFSNVQANQFDFNWTDGNGSNRAVFVLQGNSGTASPVNNTTYNPNTTFLSGDQIGATGWFCVFNGTTHASGVTLLGLTPLTTYRVMVCEYNGSAGAELYNSSTAANNPNNQSTIAAAALTPPTLIAAIGATVDADFDITYTDNPLWRVAVSSVQYGATTLTPGTDYSLSAGILTLKPTGGNAALHVAGTQTVTVTSAGYNNATVSQAIGAGAPNKLAMNIQPTAPATNGGALANQPSVFIQDQYGNATASLATVTANTGSGAWTPTGNTTANGLSGTATFSGLTATSAAAVTGATINFTSPSLAPVVSGPFNIPAPPTLYTWNAGDGSWAVAGNWSPNGVPGNGDAVQFTGASPVIVSNVPSVSLTNFTISGTGAVTLQAAGTVTVNVGGGSAPQFNVAGSSSLILDGASVITINVLTGNTGSVSGAISAQAGAHKLTAVSASGITFNSGGSFAAGNLITTGFSGNPFGSGTSNSIVFASGSTYIQNEGSNPFQKTQPASVVVFQTGSLFRLNGNLAPSFSGRTYADFEYNNSVAPISTSGAAVLNMDNLTVTQGTLSIGMTGAVAHSIKGSISVAPGAFLNFNAATASTMNLNGASTQFITGGGTVSITTSTQTISIAPGSVASVSSGTTLNCGTGLITGNGNFTLSGGATLGVGSNTGVSGNITVSGVQTFDNGANYVFNGATQSTGFPNDPMTMNNVAFSSSVSVTPASVLNVNGNLSITSAVLSNTFNKNITVAGNWINGATYSKGTETITFNGAGNNQTLSGTNNFTNLTINHTGAGNVSASGSTLTVSGLLDVLSGTFISATSYADVQIDPMGTLSGDGNIINVSGNWNNSGTFIHNNSEVNFNGTTVMIGLSINTFKNLTISGTLTAPASSNMNVEGNWLNNGTFNATSGNIIFNGGTAQNITGSSLTTFDHLTINNGNGVSLSGSVNAVVNNILYLTSGNITTNSNTMVLNNGGSVSRTSGHVVGNFQKSISIGPTTFEIGTSVYAPATIDLVGGGTQDIVAKVTQGANPNENNPTPNASGINQGAKANHYWTITKIGGGPFTTYDATFDVSNTANTGNVADYKVSKFDAPSTWIGPSGSAAGSLVTATGYTNFSEFEVGEAFACSQVTNINTTISYCTLQDAINDPLTLAGHTLELNSNITEGLVTVNKDLTIDGNGFTLTSTSPNWGINPSVPGVTLIDLTVFDAATFGIIANCGANNLALTNVTVNSCGGSGISLAGADNCVLTNITSTNNGGNGISITNCDNTTINGLTTSGNTFGLFGAGIGLFTSNSSCPPNGINGFTLTGTLNIAENPKVYSQKISAADVITGLNGASISWAVGTSALDRSYWPSKAIAYSVVDALFEAPYNFPNTTVFVAEVATENMYVDDNPNADATPPMLIQTAVNFADPGKTIFAEIGTFNEDLSVGKQLKISGAGIGSSTVIGPIGGGGSTFQVTSSGVIIEGFTITRAGNNTTDWNNSGLNTAGIAIQSQGINAEIRNNELTGLRTGIDINNSNGNNVHNNNIHFNRTGMIFRNTTDNTSVLNNFIKNNWTVGVLFLDGSSSQSNVPVQSAANSFFNNNDISANWYGQIADRQTGGSLPAPGANPKNFTCNWYGTTSPVVTTANTTEPPYAMQIPVAYGGGAAAPGGQPDIAGPASANFVYIPYLVNGTDVGGNSNDGFQPVVGCSAPCALILTPSSTDATCPSYNNGTATVNVTGGTGTYTYLWSNSQTTQTATGLTAATYTVTVSDVNGCTSSTNVTVSNSPVGPVQNINTGFYYCTLQAAINAPQTLNGHTLELTSNITEGLVTVNKDLTIDGNGFTLTSTSPNWGINPSVPGVTLIDLTVFDAATFGIIANCGANNLALTNVTVNSCGGSGISLAGADNCVLTNITSTNNGGNGISITNCDNTTINGLTTSGNTFGLFGAGIGLFTSNSSCPPNGINGFTLTGTLNIAENPKVYSQKISAADVITGLNGASISWAVGTSALDRSYWPSKTIAYSVVDALFEAPYNFPNTTVFVAEVATENMYVDDNPNGDATPPMLIQTAVNFADPGKTIFAETGTFNEDVSVGKQLKISGAGIGSSTVIGPIGGGGSTFQVTSSGVIIEGFTITRAGNNTTDWNNSGLNTAGIAIQSQGINAEIRNNEITGLRTGIDINNSNGNNVHNNNIHFNRTGMIFRNTTNNTFVLNNFIKDNWTVGVLFLDGSSSQSNVPVQSAANSFFNNNDISANWYGQIADRQTGGSLPAPGANPKNFTCNWYGTITPVVTTANTTEPPYAMQIPVAYGGGAAAPGGQPDIAGPASANFVYAPYLLSGIDVGGNPNDGFQPVVGCSAPCALILTPSSTDATCPNFNNGTATVNVTGGTGSYTYLWSNSQTTQTATGLTAATYTVTVSDVNGCTASTNATVSNSTSGPVHNNNTGLNYCTIQAAINAPQTMNGHLIITDPGTYVENVTVNKSVIIQGSGQASTFVIPASSNPNCGGAGGGSICAGGSNVFLIQANNVIIHDLTVDGDNTLLTSGTVVGGADLDARNGIITDHLSGIYQNLEVYNVTVKNIYLRGIYASTGGSFNFHNNNVSNVQASTSSIGIFNFGGTGFMTNNVVSDCNDAISANNSKGTTFSGNSVSSSSSGIHTDNNGSGGGVADVIDNNIVQNSDLNGYGIWVFAAYRNVQVSHNTVNNVDVGMACAGLQAAVTPVFFENEIDGQNKVNSTGMYITTDLFGFGTSNVSVSFNNNYVKNNAGDGFFLESESGRTLTLQAHNNSITDNSPFNAEQGTGGSGAGSFVVDMTCNWWGSNMTPAVAATISGAAITYIPFLHSPTDNSASIGFQPAASCSAPCNLVATASSTPAICPSTNNGTATANVVSGGTGTYSYLWSDGQTTQTATGLVAGIYNVTITDLNGCTTTASATVGNDSDDGNACTTDACNTSNGMITHTPSNTDDGNVCTTDDCNTSTGAITHTNVTGPYDDSNACTNGEACNNGVYDPGTPANTDDGNACTDDGCNTSTGVFHNPTNVDDGNACTTDGCNTLSGPTHTPVNTDDGNPCTDDGCNTSTGVFHNPVSTDDGNACTDDGCNTSTGVFHNPTNVDDGNACTTDGCNTLSGPTHTPVNTDDGNACTDDGCNTSTGVFHNPVSTDDGNACTDDGCNTSTGVFHNPTNVDDGNACTTDGCNTLSGPTHTPVNTDDGNACTDDGCNTSTGVFHNPVSTDDGNACTDDGCNTSTGVFHNPTNVDDGNACTTDGCNTVTGPTHTPVNTDDSNACTDDGCNTSTGVFHNPVSTDDGNACTDDGCNTSTGVFHNPTNVDDGNACTTDGCNTVSGPTHTPVNTDDGNACTTDGCNTSTGVFHTPVITNDGNACTDDGCNTSTGVFHNPTNVDDGNACTTDGCNTLSGPTHTPVNTDDGNACTTDGCNTSTGVFHTPVITNDGNACTDDGCNTSTGVFHNPTNVDDGNACTTDGCNTLSGPTHTPVNTDDGNACTVDGCNTLKGPSHTPLNTDDGNACTVDGCNTSTGATHTPLNVDDGNACTVDGCNTSTGATHTPLNVDDGNACTVDGCNTSTGATHTPLNTNDGNACTVDGCNTSTGATHTPVNTDDGNACTDDGCNTSTGVFHNPTNTNDGNACTDDGCNTSTGVFHNPTNTDDGNACTDDGCNTSTGVFHNPVSTDDGNACTDDGCNTSTGVFHNPTNTNDGNACTDDGCNTSTGVFHNPVLTDDGNACTDDGCNTSTGVFHNPTNTNDGNACTDDGCNTSTGVFHNPVSTDDGNACTDDGCNTSTGVFHNPTNTNDGNACTDDGCNTSTGVFHNPVSTDDGNACTDDGCNTSTGVFHNPTNTNDGNACTDDGCDTSTGVFHNPVDTDDGNSCTTDACDTGTGAVTHDDNSPTVTGTPGTIACYGGTTCVDIQATGGTPPYSGTGLMCPYGAGDHIFTVTDNKGCSVDVSVHIDQPTKLNVNATSTPADCSGNTGTATANANGGTPSYSYLWSPGGQTTQTATGLGAGTYSVTVTDANGCTATSSTVVGTTGGTPAAPGPIQGPNGICKGQCATYSVAPVPGATSYTWTISATGTTGTSTTNVITICVNSKFKGGYICVKANSPCGSSANTCKNIIKIDKAPSTPGTISGPVNICTMSPSVVSYSVAPVSQADSYTWVADGGLIIASGNGTNQITVNVPAGFTKGKVKVKAINCKGYSGERKLDVKGGSLGNATTPAGPSPVCKNSTKNYTTSAPGTGPITYTWTANNGAIVSGGQGSNNANIKFNGATSTSVTITVTASNPYCGTTATASRTVVVNLSCREGVEPAPVSIVQSLSAYPNPTAGKATITFTSESAAKYTLKVVDIIGRAMFTDVISAVEGFNMKEINLDNVAKGIYLVSVQTDQGDAQTIRLIVE